MNSLKFLGKLAPDILWNGERYVCNKCNLAFGNKVKYWCDCRREHLEGAIKEAAIMIREDLIADGEWWEWRHNFEKLLRQTIGERT